MTEKVLTFYRSTNIIEKAVRSKSFWVLFIALVFGYPILRSVNRELPEPLPVYSKVPQFSLTTQHKETFGSLDLNGKIYIASFAFTTCPTTCPRIMEKLQVIQKRVKGLGQNVALVTFSVDPENDTPEVLLKHSKKYQANPYVWKFLTGEKASMRNIVVDGFKVPMGDKEAVEKKVAEESVTMFDIAHTEKVVLVDGSGNIRGYYSIDKDSVNKLMIDVGLLANNMFKY